MRRRLAIRNARVFDSPRARFLAGCTVVVEGERIAPVTQEPIAADDAEVIDAGGRALLPGLMDAHVHVVAPSHDLVGLAMQPPSLLAAEAGRIMREMLHRGFTTVRDAAGADWGLQQAQQRGLFEGPRLCIAGQPISQTGGHADMRPKGIRSREMSCACAGLGLVGAIADGASARCGVPCASRCAAAPTRSRSWLAAASPARPIRSRARSSRSRRCRARPFTAAQLLRQEGRLGAVVPGAWADLLLVEGEPEAGLDMLAAPERGIRLLMQGGRILRDALRG